MGKRTLIYCDYCKEEYDDTAAFFKISIKKPKSRAAGNSYEICEACAENLQMTLVSREKPSVVQFEKTLEKATKAPQTSSSIPDFPEDELMQKIEERERLNEGRGPKTVKPQSGKCSHINKTRPRPGIDDSGSKGFYRECRECGYKSWLPKKDEARQYLNAKTPNGFNIGDRE